MPSFRTFWPYLRYELLYVAWATMEIALIVPLALAIMPWASYWPPLTFALWLLLVLFIPFNLTRLMSLRQVPLARQRLILAIALLAAMLLALRLLLFAGDSIFDLSWLGQLYGHAGGDHPFVVRDRAIIFLVALAWWRGIALAGRPVDIGNTGFRFRLGTLLLAPVIALSGGLLPWDVTPFIALFLMASLLSFALTRAEQIELEKSGSAFPMNLRWLAVVAVAALLVVTAALAMAIVAGGGTVPQLIAWSTPLWLATHFLAAATLNTFLFIISPLLFLFDLFLSWLIAFASRTIGPGFEEIIQQIQAAPDESLLESLRSLAEEPVARDPNRFWPFLAIGVLVILVVLTLGKLYRQRPMAADGGVLTSPDGKATRIGDKGLGARLKRRLEELRTWRATASIRRIYQQMAGAAAAQGFPRGQAETPYEYLDILAELWPERTEDTRLITDAYIQTRYGEIPETEAELRQIIEAWNRVEKVS